MLTLADSVVVCSNDTLAAPTFEFQQILFLAQLLIYRIVLLLCFLPTADACGIFRTAVILLLAD